jgi:hypothetical protein
LPEASLVTLPLPSFKPYAAAKGTELTVGTALELVAPTNIRIAPNNAGAKRCAMVKLLRVLVIENNERTNEQRHTYEGLIFFKGHP